MQRNEELERIAGRQNKKGKKGGHGAGGAYTPTGRDNGSNDSFPYNSRADGSYDD